MNISVAGIGYVGLSLAVLLAQNNHVTAVDVNPERVSALNDRVSPIKDELISEYLSSRKLDLSATLDATAAYEKSDLVIIATPTSYDQQRDAFDTHHVEEVVCLVEKANPNALVVVKSTVPVGYTQDLAEAHPALRLLFSPEFLREGRALHDNLHPSRVIVGTTSTSFPQDEMEHHARAFAKLLDESASEHGIPSLIMGSTEAEAVKLFSNTYLAMRVSFFNELDSYAATHGLDAAKVIQAVGLDPRIGEHYNNPSFGYGGYCLPKDSKQLLANFGDTPQELISAIVSSNVTRKDFVSDQVAEMAADLTPDGSNPTVGIYRLTMKAGSDNYRESAIIGVARRLRERGCSLVVFEPTYAGSDFEGMPVEKSLAEFKRVCDVIVANRWSDELEDVSDKVYTRDLFSRD